MPIVAVAGHVTLKMQTRQPIDNFNTNGKVLKIGDQIWWYDHQTGQMVGKSLVHAINGCCVEVFIEWGNEPHNGDEGYKIVNF